MTHEMGIIETQHKQSVPISISGKRKEQRGHQGSTKNPAGAKTGQTTAEVCRPRVESDTENLNKATLQQKKQKKTKKDFCQKLHPDALSGPLRPPMSTWDGLWHQSWLTYDAVLSSSCQGLSIPSHLTQITANNQRMTARWVSDSQVTLTTLEARTHMASACESVKKHLGWDAKASLATWAWHFDMAESKRQIVSSSATSIFTYFIWKHKV